MQTDVELRYLAHMRGVKKKPSDSETWRDPEECRAAERGRAARAGPGGSPTGWNNNNNVNKNIQQAETTLTRSGMHIAVHADVGVVAECPRGLVLVALVTKARAQRLRLDSGIRAEDGGL